MDASGNTVIDLLVSGASALSLLSLASGAADGPDRVYVRGADGEPVQPAVAVDNVCAWPNLTQLPDGTIVATIHNQPSHLKQPADVECWASEDGGQTWAKRGTPAPRDTPRVARGNVAAGLATNGDLIVISSGWSDPVAETRGTIMPPLVSRSSDGGRTWSIDPNGFPEPWPEEGRREMAPEGHLVPFGDILVGRDGMLRVGLYGGGPGSTRIYRSSDDGTTWTEAGMVSSRAVIHEPAFLHLGGGRWLLAARLNGLDLYVSEDDGRTWTLREKLTDAQQHPGHLLRLRDGTLLLTYGNREEPKGVDIRVSRDEGETWSRAFRAVDFIGDGGYPSSVQLADGRILTAYYARRVQAHGRYHMGVVVWEPAATFEQ